MSFVPECDGGRHSQPGLCPIPLLGSSGRGLERPQRDRAVEGISVNPLLLGQNHCNTERPSRGCGRQIGCMGCRPTGSTVG